MSMTREPSLISRRRSDANPGCCSIKPRWWGPIESRRGSTRTRIAICDYAVTETSPSGSCHLRLLEELRDDFDFTVFASEFTNPDSDRIRWVRTPSIKRPLAARYCSYYATSVALRLVERHKSGAFELVQAVEGYTEPSDISYVHLCHRSYLRGYASEGHGPGVQGAIRRLDHRLRAVSEMRALSVPRLLVVPSPFLKHELVREYALEPGRIRVVPNPIDAEHFDPPPGFPRAEQRQSLGVAPGDLLAIFVALGRFEHKGLPQLLDAMTMTSQQVHLAVVGGRAGLVRAYRSRARRLGLSGRTIFVGTQQDVRPFLWAADVFVSPSIYETFSLVLHQAAAAGLPLIVTPLAGGGSFFRHGLHGLSITRDASDIARALRTVAAMDPKERGQLGANAKRAVQGLGVARFAEAWRGIYDELLAIQRAAP